MAHVILAHQTNRFRFQYLLSVQAAFAEDHSAECQIIPSHRIKSAASHMEFRILRELKVDRREAAVRHPGVHPCEARTLIRADLESGLGHAERRKYVILQVYVELLPAQFLHHLASK